MDLHPIGRNGGDYRNSESKSSRLVKQPTFPRGKFRVDSFKNSIKMPQGHSTMHKLEANIFFNTSSKQHLSNLCQSYASSAL